MADSMSEVSFFHARWLALERVKEDEDEVKDVEEDVEVFEGMEEDLEDIVLTDAVVAVVETEVWEIEVEWDMWDVLSSSADGRRTLLILTPNPLLKFWAVELLTREELRDK